ncbi:MAG TPA: hypothetical protein VNM66_08915 [Thermodesulfobacteriota bacterium]|nr:hypothetical protein [Thermodesulfobacteriota bacterium]
MSEGAYVIYDPTVEPEGEAFAPAPRPASLAGRRVVLLDNGKANAGRLLELVGERLAARTGAAVVRLVRKGSAYRPATEAELEEAAREADLVVAGIGD